jgi:DNA repair protein RadC
VVHARKKKGLRKMKTIYTTYYEVNRKCFDRKIGDTVTKRKIFSTFEDALKYARRYTKTTKNINYVDAVVFENIYELTFEPTEVEAEIFTPVKKNKMYQLDTKGMNKDLRIEENEDKQYEVEEYVFAVPTKKEAVKIAKEIANKRRKAIKVFKNSEQIEIIEPELNKEVMVMKKVSEKTAEYVTDKELISMLVKEPVDASIYDFMREPEKIKISKKGKKKLMAVRDLVKRALVAIPEKKKAIRTPKDVVDIMMKYLRYEAKENFYVLILDTKNQVINISKISEGSVNTSIVNPANVFKEVLKYETSNSIVLAHNHPSGDPTPSIDDVNITEQIIKAGKLLNIEIIDHIIIGDGIYTSFKKEEIIKNNNIDMHMALQKYERS